MPAPIQSICRRAAKYHYVYHDYNDDNASNMGYVETNRYHPLRRPIVPYRPLYCFVLMMDCNNNNRLLWGVYKIH